VLARRIAAAAVPAAVLTSAAGCSAGPVVATPGVVRVVAAENVWGDIARQIGGSHVEVTSIINDPNVDPHTYQSDPRDAAAISDAQLVIENGLGYDDFVDDVLATGGRSGRLVLTVSKAMHVTASDANPHLWYLTDRLSLAARAIAEKLRAIDPQDAESFTGGATHFIDTLKPLQATIASINSQYAGTEIAYTERVPGYLVQAAGLALGTPASFSQAIEDGNDPSPQDAAAFSYDLTHHVVKVLIYNSQIVDAQTQRIKQTAERAQVPVVGMSETLPARYPTFQAWQLAQDRALLRALGV
jgi:zinc/manganese transport system substrate-binding protein